MSGEWKEGPQVFKPMVQACIDLRIPETGNVELDALIARAQLRDVAAVILAGMWAYPGSENPDGKLAIKTAAALIERCGEGK